jgi:hypothetical protein
VRSARCRAPARSTARTTSNSNQEPPAGNGRFFGGLEALHSYKRMNRQDLSPLEQRTLRHDKVLRLINQPIRMSGVSRWPCYVVCVYLRSEIYAASSTSSTSRAQSEVVSGRLPPPPHWTHSCGLSSLSDTRGGAVMRLAPRESRTKNGIANEKTI